MNIYATFISQICKDFTKIGHKMILELRQGLTLNRKRTTVIITRF